MTITPIGVYLLYFIFSHPDSHLCVPDDRNEASCFTQGNNPVCATYECQSMTGFCQKTITDSCLACQDSKVVAYLPGECKNTEASRLCTKKQRQEKCDKYYEDEDLAPACGYATTARLGGHDIYAQTWSSKCSACSQSQVVFNTPGECKDANTLGICKRKQMSVEDCPSLTKSACAYFSGEGCDDKICRKTMKSPCLACADTSVLFYIHGACPNDDQVSWTDEEDSIEEEEGSDFGLSAFYDSDDSDDENDGVMAHLGETLLDDAFYEEEAPFADFQEDFSDADEIIITKHSASKETDQDLLLNYKKYLMEELSNSAFYGASQRSKK